MSTESEIERSEREKTELKRRLRKKQQEAEELAMMGFLAGNMGSAYRMTAAEEMSGG